jgi:hypothetical protein
VKSIPESLSQAFKNNSLIPVIGAGVSLSVKDMDGKSIYPSWHGLLHKFADRLRVEEKPKLAAALIANVEIGRFKEAADIAREGLVGRLWGSFFRDVFTTHKKNIKEDSLKLPQSIWKLSDRVLTLNYDKILRLASDSPESLLELDNGSSAELVDFCRGSLGEPTVWHLHGKFDNAANIVLTTESYDKLYYAKNDAYRSALEAFRTLARNDTLIFIGCSLEDADLLAQISREHELFDGNAGPHYALIHTDQIALVKQKLVGLPIDLIAFKDFGQPLIDAIEEITLQGTPTLKADHTNLSLLKKSENYGIPIKISVLTANPIGKCFDYADEIREIKKLKCHVAYAPLSVRSLNELNSCDYVILLTQTFKNKLVIESDGLTSELLSVSQIHENLGASPKGIFIFSNFEKTDINKILENEHLIFPTLILPKLSKLQKESIFFKIFKRRNLKSIPDSVAHRATEFDLQELNQNHTEFRPRTILPATVDAKTTDNYVGRQTDLENIATRMVQLHERNQILTIKGSGGIGKTITIKKILVELAKRNYFSDGIDFIDCESIVDYKNIEFRISRGFDLDNVSDLKDSLRSNVLNSKRNSLLVLDNFESLIHSADSEKFIDLVNLLCDYTNVVTTSREAIGIECEIIYELRPFTTDEAYDLFCREFRHEINSSSDIKIIREQILEKILDNNPLAIKLITKNIPKGKDFTDLKIELEHNFFETFSNDNVVTFDNIQDANIERKRSLYASINYSYQHLKDVEQRAFELLSLFPDGIDLENFKRISTGRTGTKHGNTQKRPHEWRSHVLINDQAIRNLENKSVIQVDNGMIKLQSIIGRFAGQKLASREKSVLKNYYKNAFNFNSSLIDALATMLNEKEDACAHAHRIFNSYQANFVRCLDYAHEVAKDSFEYLDYLDSLGLLFIGICASGTYVREIKKRPFISFDDEKMQLCFDVSIHSARYYDGDFASAFADLKSVLSLEELFELDEKNSADWITISNAADIYCIEGYALETCELFEKINYTPVDYPHPLFQIGEFNSKLLEGSFRDFFTLETANSMGILTVKILDEYLSSLYSKAHLERIQTIYIKSKLCGVPKQIVKKLVVTNPYTAGLKSLMLAFSEPDRARKSEYFSDALNQLRHVKYYFVECLFYYASFLKETNNIEKFEQIFSLADELAKKHSYRFLEFRLNNLRHGTESEFSVKEYPLADGKNFENYISQVIQSRRH